MQAGRRVDVHVEGVEMPLDFRTPVKVPHQLGLSHPSGRREQDVRLVGDRPDQPVGLRFPVAEVRGRDDAGDIEWIHRSSFFDKDNGSHRIIQIL